MMSHRRQSQLTRALLLLLLLRRQLRGWIGQLLLRHRFDEDFRLRAGAVARARRDDGVEVGEGQSS